MNEEIETILAREILDSRGYPTIEVDLFLKNGMKGRASIPSGASTGTHEAFELRDKDPKRFHGKGVLRAIQSVEEIAFAIKGKKASDQRIIDNIMIDLDGTDNKHRLGANAILAVSLAAARAAANFNALPLYRYLGGMQAKTIPFPFFNIINGGAHADNELSFQEFMVAPRLSTFKDNLIAGSEIYHSLKILLKKRNLSTNIGDEGGFAPNISSNEAALDLILDACEAAGYSAGTEIMIALDVAASEIEDTEGLIEQYEELVERYPIISIEDGCKEDDFEGWEELTKRLGKRIQIVGDDLFVTNVDRLKEGVQRGLANALLVKPNQTGTLSETLDAIRHARQAGYAVMMSHRSGETEDSFIADLAVALNVEQAKFGAPSRGERIAKYNQLLRIEEDLLILP